MSIYWMRAPTPLGEMILAANPEGLIGAWFEGQAHFAGIQPDWQHDAQHALLLAAAAQLAEWFAGQRQVFELPLAPQGTAFQHAVWAQLRQIGFGHTASYGELAASLGKPAAARAVGAATGRNPLTIIVPCHRLLAGNGALTGFAGGIPRKQWLLAHEQQGLPLLAEAGESP